MGRLTITWGLHQSHGHRIDAVPHIQDGLDSTDESS
jgi:hypothetical protein